MTFADLFLIFIGFILHECGHYMTARLFGFKAKLGINSLGLYCAYWFNSPTLPKKSIVISLMGVLGVFPFLCNLSSDVSLVAFLTMTGYSCVEVLMRVRSYRKSAR